MIRRSTPVSCHRMPCRLTWVSMATALLDRHWKDFWFRRWNKLNSLPCRRHSSDSWNRFYRHQKLYSRSWQNSWLWQRRRLELYSSEVCKIYFLNSQQKYFRFTKYFWPTYKIFVNFHWSRVKFPKTHSNFQDFDLIRNISTGAVTSFVCAFTPLCTITFLGRPLALLRQETKEMVEKIGSEITADRIKRASDIFKLAFDKYSQMQKEN